MPVVNFKEISKADAANGEQDSFELFAREFLQLLGYKIEAGPDRGSDGGRDLIVSETLKGIYSKSEKKWLVSCKHYAHSGRSVKPSHEKNVKKRLHKYECQGFIGFYSTLHHLD